MSFELSHIYLIWVLLSPVNSMKLRDHSYNIQFTHILHKFKESFIMFTKLFKHHHYLISEQLYHPPKRALNLLAEKNTIVYSSFWKMQSIFSVSMDVLILMFLITNRIIQLCGPFMSAFFHIAYFQRSSKVQHVSVFYSFVQLDNISLYEYNTFCISHLVT